MKYNLSDKVSSSNYSIPGGESAPYDPGVAYGVDKLSGYNEGFQKALSTYHDIVLVIFLTYVFQIVTHRLVHREYPFQITFTDPFNPDNVIFSWGSQYQLSDRAEHIISVIDGALFAAGLTLAAYLVLQVFGVPAYSWEVTVR